MFLTLWATALAPLLALPRDLLFHAGCVLFPIAIFMAVLASLAVLMLRGPNMLGVGFLAARALVVALLALAEFKAVSRQAAGVS